MTTTVQTGTGKYEKILERCQDLEPVPTSVAYPCDETSLAGAIDAAAQGLIAPILVGPENTIREIARAKGIDWVARPSKMCLTAAARPRALSRWCGKGRPSW